MKRIDLPAPIFFAWLVLTVVLMLQGLRLAQDRQEGLQPHRPVTLAGGGEIEIPPGDGWIVYAPDRPGRLAVFQVLPERKLLRWIEDAPSADGPLLIPTAGFGPGQYLVADAPDQSGAAAQEMDRPDETVPARARFTVLPD